MLLNIDLTVYIRHVYAFHHPCIDKHEQLMISDDLLIHFCQEIVENMLVEMLHVHTALIWTINKNFTPKRKYDVQV